METDCNCKEKEITAMNTNDKGWICPSHGRVTQAPGFAEARTRNNENDWQKEALFWRAQFFRMQQAAGALQEALWRFGPGWPTDFQTNAVAASDKANTAIAKAMERKECTHKNGTQTKRQ